MRPFQTGKVRAANKSGAGKLSSRRLAIVEKRAAATRLRAAGRTFTQIGEALGVTTGRAYQLVDEALYATIAAPAESLRQIELARLEQLLTGVYGKAVRGDHAAIGSVLKIMARIERLTGLDAPQQVPPMIPPGKAPLGMPSPFASLTGQLVGKSRISARIPVKMSRCPKS